MICRETNRQYSLVAKVNFRSKFFKNYWHQTNFKKNYFFNYTSKGARGKGSHLLRLSIWSVNLNEIIRKRKLIAPLKPVKRNCLKSLLGIKY